METISLIPNPNIGNATNTNGTPLIVDGLLSNDCKLSFPLLPEVVFTLQEVSLPDISVNEITQVTRFVDPNQIGEKLNFQPFKCVFMVDKNLRNWSSIFNWMKSMTQDGTAVGKTDNPVLIINGKEAIRFIEAWPTSLGGLEFSAIEPEYKYVKCELTLNYGYIDLLVNTTQDSIYT